MLSSLLKVTNLSGPVCVGVKSKTFLTVVNPLVLLQLYPRSRR